MNTFSVLLRHGARNLDAYRPRTLAGPDGWRVARVLLERRRVELGLDDVAPAGEGLLGWVFRATQRALGRPVAVKVGKLPGRTAAEDAIVLQAAAMARLDHRGVPRVHGAGLLGDDGPGYVVLEWVDGEDLERARARGAVWTAERMLEVLVQVAEALVHGHARGVVHGDLKPANIVVPHDVRRAAALVDWSGHSIPDPTDPTGRAHAAVADPRAMPPERRARTSVEPVPADDIWAFGVTLRWAFADPGVVGGPAPPAVSRLLAVLLAPDPRERLTRAAALLAALRRCRDTSGKDTAAKGTAEDAS